MIKNLMRGFKGGPDFDNCVEVTALMEDWQLNIDVPATKIVTEEPPRNINYPFNQDGWFQSHSKQSSHYHYVEIDTQLWYYLPVNVLFKGELGLLSLSTQLRKIHHDKTINTQDLDALGNSIIAEYDEYYNAPIDSPNGPGPNVSRRKKREDEVRQAWDGFITEEEIQAKIEERYREPYPPMPEHQIVPIQGKDWVFCVENSAESHTHSNIYSIPLNEKYYLSLHFRHRVDWQPKYQSWKQHADQAEKKIMQTVRLEKVTN